MADLDDMDLDANVDYELDAMNEQLEDSDDADGYYARDQNGEIHFFSYPDAGNCGGSGILHCYCGGDICVCGNQGEIECAGCEDCELDEDDHFEED